MKLEFNGHFTKEELLNTLDTLLDKFLSEGNKSSDSPLKIDSPTIELQLVNNRGVKRDILDTNGDSLFAQIPAGKEDFDITNVSASEVNLKTNLLKEQDIDDWMVLEVNGLNCPNYIWDELELVGYFLTSSASSNYPRVFSVEQFCKNHNVEVVSKRYSNEYVDIKEAERLLGDQSKYLSCAKLYLADDEIVELFDITDISSMLGINYTPYREISYPVIPEEKMLGIPRDLYEHESLGKTYCTVYNPYPHWDFTRIFNVEDILNNNHLNLFTADEVQSERYTKLMYQTDLHVFPKHLKIKNNIEVVGYELSDLRNIFKPVYDVGEFLKGTFPAISEEELPKYPVASAQCLRKLKTDSKKFGIDFESIEIVGITKDNLLVFNNTIPVAFKEIIDAYKPPVI